LDQAKGQLEQALAQQKLDNANLERSKDLLAKKVIAQQDFDTTASQKYVADAQVGRQPSRSRIRATQS
jgi:multidrug resistance efflux pump